MLKINLLIFCAIILLTIYRTNGSAIPFADCGSAYDLRKVDIQNCNNLPCPLFMLQSTDVTIHLMAGFQAKSLSQNITITTKGVRTSTWSTPGTCTSQRPCPTGPGDVSFTTKLYVPDIAPFPSKLMWKITDGMGKTLMCFYTDVYLCDQGTDDEKCYQ